MLIRGTYGRDEWISNVNVSNKTRKAEKLHEGFARAADSVYEVLAKYVKKHNIKLSDAKVLITGHSRGAAVANILAARLDEDSTVKGKSFEALKRNSLYAYTFATPNTVIDKKGELQRGIYANIFNIVNPEDIVPKVPLNLKNTVRL